MRAKILLATGCMYAMLPSPSLAGENPSAQELVKSILASERQLRDVQAQIACYIPKENGNELFYKFTWGYAGGKEFYEGEMISGKSALLGRHGEHGTNYSEQVLDRAGVSVEKKAFDGQKAYMYRQDSLGKVKTGLVGSLRPEEFSATMTPRSLLGYDAKDLSRESLGEALSKASTLSIGESRTINGHMCVCVEAIGFETDPVSGAVYDVRVWVDPKRDFRPLRIEECDSIEGANRWKVPARTIEDIELAQIGGIWFPIKGTRSTYKVTEVLPPEGMSQEEFDKLPLKEVREKGRISVALLGGTQDVLMIDQATIRINQGIPDEAFRVVFPQGCVVWDEFIQMGYTVGAKLEPGDSIAMIDKPPVMHDDKTAKSDSSTENADNAKSEPHQSLRDVRSTRHESGSRNDLTSGSPTLIYASGIIVGGILLLIVGIVWYCVQRRRASSSTD